jgi:EAL domain-containing protein (putative c-di-GMP-specific phosphodiesterase class I)
MYKAKALGGARSEIFDQALGRELRLRATAQRMLQSALDERRVTAQYQPIVDLAKGAVAGFEALARITQRDGATIPPAEFIPAGEESGLVVVLGQQVLTLACAEARGWPAALDAKITVAVNLSARQFESGQLAATVHDCLEATGLDPSRLCLELTETALIDLRPNVLSQMGQLRDLGVEIGLDDFGTGYASLTHLRHLPITFVKIDQSFVRGIGDRTEDDRIVAAVIDLAANLGLRSIAEGVETEVQSARLREFGCDHAQGYLYARPLSAEAVPTAFARASW